jgi:hypothetical protein
MIKLHKRDRESRERERAESVGINVYIHCNHRSTGRKNEECGVEYVNQSSLGKCMVCEDRKQQGASEASELTCSCALRSFATRLFGSRQVLIHKEGSEKQVRCS